MLWYGRGGKIRIDFPHSFLLTCRAVEAFLCTSFSGVIFVYSAPPECSAHDAVINAVVIAFVACDSAARSIKSSSLPLLFFFF